MESDSSLELDPEIAHAGTIFGTNFEAGFRTQWNRKAVPPYSYYLEVKFCLEVEFEVKL